MERNCQSSSVTAVGEYLSCRTVAVVANRKFGNFLVRQKETLQVAEATGADQIEVVLIPYVSVIGKCKSGKPVKAKLDRGLVVGVITGADCECRPVFD